MLRKIIRITLLTVFAVAVLFYGAFWIFLRVGAESVPFGQNSSLYSRSYQNHDMTLLNDGVSSFAKRIRAIRSANKSIELEFFIFNVDQSSRILTQELIRKASQGVRIRILVDFAAPVFRLAPMYVSFLKKAKIEVRYYNTSQIYRIFAFQHRSHRKLLIVDDEVLITGGSNIADEYFNLGSEYNSLDSDVIIRGEIVPKVRESFDLYWNSGLAFPSADDRIDSQAVEARFFHVTDEDAKLLDEILQKSLSRSLRTHLCADLTFVTDSPGVDLANRKVYPLLRGIFSEAKSEIYGKAPTSLRKKGPLKF